MMFFLYWFHGVLATHILTTMASEVVAESACAFHYQKSLQLALAQKSCDGDYLFVEHLPFDIFIFKFE